MHPRVCAALLLIAVLQASNPALIRLMARASTRLGSSLLKGARQTSKKIPSLKATVDVSLSDTESSVQETTNTLDVDTAPNYNMLEEDEYKAIGMRLRAYLNDKMDDAELGRVVMAKTGKGQAKKTKMPSVSVGFSAGRVSMSKKVNFGSLMSSSGGHARDKEEEPQQEQQDFSAAEPIEHDTAMTVFEGNLRSSYDAVQTVAVQQFQHKMAVVFQHMGRLLIAWYTRSGISLSSHTKQILLKALTDYYSVIRHAAVEATKSMACSMAQHLAMVIAAEYASKLGARL